MSKAKDSIPDTVLVPGTLHDICEFLIDKTRVAPMRMTFDSWYADRYIISLPSTKDDVSYILVYYKRYDLDHKLFAKGKHITLYATIKNKDWVDDENIYGTKDIMLYHDGVVFYDVGMMFDLSLVLYEHYVALHSSRANDFISYFTAKGILPEVALTDKTIPQEVTKSFSTNSRVKLVYMQE